MSGKRKRVGLFDELRCQLTDGLMDRYRQMAYNVFVWDGMPCPRRYPETMLFSEGMSTVFVPEGTDTPVVARVATESINRNWYGEPVKWRAVPVAGNLFSEQVLTPENAVLMRNSDTYTPTEPYVRTLVEQLVNTELTTRMNMNAQKMPFYFMSEDGNKALQNKNDFMDLMECNPVFIKTDLGSEFQVFVSNAPMICRDLMDVYNEYDSRILEYIGVRNLPVEKKERMLVDEVNVNMEELDLGVRGRLEQRRIACDAMADVLDMDVSVELRLDSYRETVPTGDTESGEEEDE